MALIPIEEDTQVDIKDYARKTAESYGIPWDVAQAHIKVESNWNPKAKAQGGNLGGQYEPPSSAKGLMQLIDSTAKDMGVDDPLDPYQNISGGMKYLKSLHDKYGDWSKASQAYKQGPGGLDKKGPDVATNAHMDKLIANSTTLFNERYKEVDDSTPIPQQTEIPFKQRFVPVEEEGPSAVTEAVQAVGGTVGVLADFAPYFAGLPGLMSQGVAGLTGLAVGGYELATGADKETALNKSVEAIKRVQGWTTPTRVLTEKMGVPSPLIHNKAYDDLSHIISYIPEKLGEISADAFTSPEGKAAAYTLGNFTGNAVLFHAVGGAKTVGIDLQVGNVKYSDLTPFKIFQSNTKAGLLSTFSGLWGANKPGTLDIGQVVSPPTMRTLPTMIRREITRLQKDGKPLPSAEMENILKRPPNSWSIDDKLSLISWDKEIKAINQGTYDPATGWAQIPKISDGQLFWSFNPVRPTFSVDVLRESLLKVNTRPFSLETETLPTKYAWAMRGIDRGMNQKADTLRTITSVEQRGITEPIEVTYSMADNSFVVSKGNTKLFAAVRENIPEVPVYIRMVVDHDPAMAKNAVSADAFNLNQNMIIANAGRKQVIKPSEAGLPGRNLLIATNDPLGANTHIGTKQGYWWSSPQMAGEVISKARTQALGLNIKDIISLTTPDVWEVFRNKIDPKAETDISPSGRTIYGYGFSPEQAGEVSKSPIINWAASVISDVKKTSDLQASKWLNGTTVGRVKQVFGLRTTVKSTADPKSWGGMLKDGLTTKELTALREADLEWSKQKIDAGPNEYKAKGFNQKQIDAFEAKKKFTADILSEINKTHAKYGLPLVKDLPGYTTSVRQGDFFVEVKDPVGNTLYRQQVNSTGKILGIPTHIYGASRLKDVLRKTFPGMQVNVGEITRGPGNPFAVSVMKLDQLNNFISDLGAQKASALGIDPYTPYLIEQLIEVRQKAAGFGGHKQLKQFVPGQKGNEINFSERAKNKSYIEAQEIYSREAANYISNIQLDHTLGKAIADPRLGELPITTQLLTDMKDHAKGAFEIGGEDKFMNSLIDIPLRAIGGLGPSAGVKAIAWSTRMAYFSWLHLKMPFYMSQVLQPMQFLPAELAHWQSKGFSGKITNASLKGIGDLINPSDGFLKYLEHGIANQVLDPQLIKSIGLKAFGLAEKPVFRYLIGEKIQASLEKAGRLEAAATAYNFFKDSGVKDQRQLNALIDQVVNNTMVDFHRTAAPAIYRSGNYLTQAMGVLSRYHHNYVAQFTKYMSDFKEHGAVKPIGMFLAMQAITAGMVGMLGVDIADWIIDHLRKNSIVPANFPTVTEYFVKNTNDLVSFGLPSILSGELLDKSANFGKSLAAPRNIPDNNSLFPSIGWLGDIGEAAWGALSPGRQHTDIERAHLLNTITPTFAKGFMEKYNPMLFGKEPLQPGDLVPMLGDRGVGGFKRDEGDWQARFLGTKSLDETRKQTVLSTSKATEKAMTEKKKVLIGTLAEGMKGDERIDTSSIIKELVGYGVEPKVAVKSAVDLLVSQHLEANIRFHGKNPKSLSAIEKYKLLKGQGIINE